MISFLLDNKALREAWDSKPLTEEDRVKYLKFRDDLTAKSVCKLYSDVAMPKIDRDVLNALNEVIDSHQLRPLAGWTRREGHAARLANALQGNDFLMRIMDRVVGFNTTGARLEKEAGAKRAAAEMFWDSMMNHLAREGYVNLFIESGSSLANVSEVFEQKLSRQKGRHVATNNALALLQLLLFTDGEIQRNPPVAPDPLDPYGAIFTRKCREAYEDPPVKPRPLFDKEIEAIHEIVELLKCQNGKQIILATASGWDTTHSTIEFQGPHVGSHPNMLFKRSIFLAGDPVVLFLSRHRIDPSFRESRFKCRTDSDAVEPGMRHCYPVFDEEFSLAQALRENAVAICIGYETEEGESSSDIHKIRSRLKDVMRPHLEPAGFDFEYAAKEFVRENGTATGALMLANEKFKSILRK